MPLLRLLVFVTSDNSQMSLLHRDFSQIFYLTVICFTYSTVQCTYNKLSPILIFLYSPTVIDFLIFSHTVNITL